MIILICGPAASGKSTIARKLQEKLAKQGKEFKLLHSDQFASHPYTKMFEEVKNGGDWILAGTFYKRKFRQPFHRLDSKLVLIKASLETCLARNRSRMKPIEEKAVGIIWKEFEEPQADLVIDSDKLPAGKAAEEIIQKFLSLFQS